MPQLNPEFFVSQLFWLSLTFVFLFIFLWRISLPRIGKVLDMRENKINNDIKLAKKMQTEAEEIQKNIDNQLQNAKIEAANSIKNALVNFQNSTSKELEKIDKELEKQINESTSMIEKNKIDSKDQIDKQIYDIVKITLSKISSINADNDEIKKIVDNIQKEVIN